MTTIKIARFNFLTELVDDPFVICAGVRRSGKTYWAKWFVETFQREKHAWDTAFCLTGTKPSGQWLDIVPEKNIFGDYFSERLLALLAEQNQLVTLHGREKARRVLLILDDILGLMPAQDQGLIQIASFGRHANISIVLLVQRWTGFVPMTRDQLDCVCMWSKLDYTTLELIHKDLLSGLMLNSGCHLQFETFRQWYSIIASPNGHRALVVLRPKEKSGDITDHVKWTLAPAGRHYGSQRRKKKTEENCSDDSEADSDDGIFSEASGSSASSTSSPELDWRILLGVAAVVAFVFL